MRDHVYAPAVSRDIINNRTVDAVIGVVSFVLFISLGAHVYVPLGFTPVPFTMQTFFVLLSGALLGKRLGSISNILYIALGATGLPLFSSGSWGIMHLFGPTGGYLLGFVACAYIIGTIVDRNDSMTGILSALIIGEAVILLSGACWLYVVSGFSIRNAYYLGIAPFVPADIIKITTALFLCKACIKRSRAIFR